MKTFLILALMISSSAFACSGEAQMYPTKIVKLEKTADSCRVFVAAARTDSNPNCPLDDSLIASHGIEVGLKKDGSCKRDVGQDLSGIVVDKGNVLVIE